MPKEKYMNPDELWQLFEKYKAEIKDHPRKRDVFVGKDGIRESERLERPLTMEGFRNFGHKNNSSIEHYFANTDNSYTDYRTICSRIRDEIRQDQIEGGMVGQYNASITQRLNGLTEKTDNQNTNINRNITVGVVKSDIPLSGSEKDIKM